jgi:broad specificity phosphatase PhoE
MPYYAGDRMTKIYLIRHGESTWNSEHKWAGHADPPLAEDGRMSAKEACLLLGKMGFKCITSSGLRRAKETASIIANELGIALASPVLELNERNFGDISGLTSNEIAVRFPSFLNKWRSGEVVDIPGGEPWPCFVARILAGLNSLSFFSGPVLVVIHEGVLRAVEHYFGEKQSKHRNLEGRWINIFDQSLTRGKRDSDL